MGVWRAQELTIAIVHEIFLPVMNGVIAAAADIARHLRKRGHRVVFIAPSGRACRSGEYEGIPVRCIPSLPSGIYPGLRMVSPWSRHASRILDEEAVDVLQLTGQGSLSWTALRAARRSGIPVVHSLHTLFFEERYLRYGLLFRRAAVKARPAARDGTPVADTAVRMPVRRVQQVAQAAAWRLIGLFVRHSDATTAPSAYVCSMLESRFPGSRLLHIDNGVELPGNGAETTGIRGVTTGIQAETTGIRGATAAVSRVENKKVLEQGGKMFLFAGRLGEEKSVGVLLEGFRRARLRDPEIRLLIAGDGPGRTRYRRIAEELGLGEAVEFLGRIPRGELIGGGLLEQARAAVTASTTENQPLSLIEAIVCGTPIIVPDLPAIGELLACNGLSFPAGDAEALADRIVRMADDDELRRRCAHESGRLAERFDAARIAEHYEGLYEELVTGAHPAAEHGRRALPERRAGSAGLRDR